MIFHDNPLKKFLINVYDYLKIINWNEKQKKKIQFTKYQWH